MPVKTNRLAWSLVLCLCLAWIGLGVGTSIGARYVPEGSGLAGPAIALGYGVLAAAVALVLGALIGWKGPVGLLRSATYVAILLAIVGVGLTARRFLSQEAERRAKLGLDVPLPPGRGFTLRADAPPTERTNRSYRTLELNGSDWVFEWVATGPEGVRCSAALVAEEAQGLSDALDGISALFAADPGLCAGSDGPDPVRVDYRGESSWTLRITGRCMVENESVKELSRRLFRLPIDAASRGEANCE